jgi:hypothetical protein
MLQVVFGDAPAIGELGALICVLKEKGGGRQGTHSRKRHEAKQEIMKGKQGKTH